MRAFLLALVLGACAAEPPAADNVGGPEGFLVTIPMTDGDGQPQSLAARLCLSRTRPAAVAIVNHGAAADRAAMQPARCDSEPAQWFLVRGYSVVFPLRRGFGASTGPMAETSGPCAEPDYVHAGVEGARDIDAATRFALALPQARPDRAVVVGQSTGGWGVVAYASQPHPGVAALVSMAGGRGGRALDDAPDSYCRPDLLVSAAAHFGATARSPMLWVYARNDTYFDPSIATALRDAYNGAGGRATLAQPAPFGSEGHALFNGYGGSLVWGPLLDRWLARAAGT